MLGDEMFVQMGYVDSRFFVFFQPHLYVVMHSLAYDCPLHGQYHICTIVDILVY
ncbi:hypothetical protein RchiOBHm_Chr5g0031151 [Rosa chinensis]|uniref:Uncharacterized protein n=1 Tax=Rosa chinensis TaxID=74649 RepID=A0A2P6QA50_ROSCH|nr:hypothetical protein RchiOBHm_Chr5g0031151 [Rosa chinensis]